MRYFIELAYNGSSFHGWQSQPNAVTVQEKIEEALRLFFREDCAVVGCGRTDTGVHANRYYAHFDQSNVFDCEFLKFKLNRILPLDIAIYQIFPVKDDFHARFDAKSRMYRYFISIHKNPFSVDRSWCFNRCLDLNILNETAKLFIGRHDFNSFAKTHSDVKTTFCDVIRSDWEQNEGYYVYNVRADRFLRNMVRALVGTQVEVSLGKRSISNVEQLLQQGTRSDAGQSVPAQGLFLWDIEYDFDKNAETTGER